MNEDTRQEDGVVENRRRLKIVSKQPANFKQVLVQPALHLTHQSEETCKDQAGEQQTQNVQIKVLSPEPPEPQAA